jgi:hypothetical protein
MLKNISTWARPAVGNVHNYFGCFSSTLRVPAIILYTAA